MTHTTHQSTLTKMQTFLLTLLLLMTAGAVRVSAQSTDPDSPLQMTSNVVEGEGDGHAATYYYRFAGGPGDIKITVDGKTDGYSSPLKVELMDEDSQTLESVYVVAVKAGKREVKKLHLIRQQPVIMKIIMQDDPDIKLLTYRVKLEGEVGFPSSSASQPSQSSEVVPQAESATVSPDPSAAPAESQPATESAAAPSSSEQSDAGQATTAPPPGVKQKAKEKAREAAKGAVNKALDKFPF